MKMSHIFGTQKVCKPFARLYKTVFDISVRKISSPTRVPVREMSESKYEQNVCSDFYRKLHDVEKKNSTISLDIWNLTCHFQVIKTLHAMQDFTSYSLDHRTCEQYLGRGGGPLLGLRLELGGGVWVCLTLPFLFLPLPLDLLQVNQGLLSGHLHDEGKGLTLGMGVLAEDTIQLGVGEGSQLHHRYSYKLVLQC